MALLISWIVTLVGLGVFLYVKSLDWRKSSQQRLHLPPGEENKFAKKGGYFSLTRALIVHGIIIGALLTPVIISTFWNFKGGFEWVGTVVGGIFGVFAFFVWVVISKDLENLERHKTEQFDILRNIKRDPENAAHYLRFNPGPKLDRDKMEWYAVHFWDLRVKALAGHEPAEQSRANGLLIEKFKKLAAKPESEWWRLDRAESL